LGRGVADTGGRYSGAMTLIRATFSGGTDLQGRIGALLGRAGAHVDLAAVSLAAFGTYWLSSLLLEAANATIHFGSDAPLYAWLGQGHAVDRVARFHPTTVVLEVGWMKLMAPLAQLIAPQSLVKALFAAVGAVGAWAAMWAFAAVVPRRYVALLGVIYAASLGVWYFSSIEESKIVTATLSALYIAVYLHLRGRWSVGGAVLLTAVLLAACLNEIVSGFLVVIPAIDALLQRGWDLRRLGWIVGHALVVPAAFLFLDLVVNGYLVPTGTDPEGASHISMLMYYIAINKFDSWAVYYFLVNWLFFSVAAPTPVLSTVFANWPANKYFAPVLTNYFSSPVTAALVVLFVAMLIASVLPRYRTGRLSAHTSLLLGLLAYALLRGAFFFVVYPYECILFSSSVTLAHMLLIFLPFATSGVPAKGGLLAAFAVLLVVTNGTFILSQ
jgi:hypothetical protein